MQDPKQANPPVTHSVSSRLIALADNFIAARAEILATRKLVPGQDAFLTALLGSDGTTMGTLAENLAISASSATKAAIKLEAANLIHREASRVDSRQNYAHLTPQGREMAREILAEYDRLDSAFFAGMKARDRERLVKILDKLENPQSGAGKKPKKAGSKKKKAKKSK